MSLTTKAIESAGPGITADGRATDKPYKLFDERGLFLLVTPAGGKWWRLNYRFAGKHKTLSLGVYPEVSLNDARERRDEARKLRAEGIDPGEYRKAAKSAQLAEEARQLAVTRFMLDSDGALSFRLGNRCLILTPAETAELRAFLDATCAVIPKVTPCL